MRQVWIHNHSKSLTSPLQLSYGETFLARLKGLTFTRYLPADRGLLLVCDNLLETAITMLGVWIDLGIIWVNEDFFVVDTVLARRWRPIYIPKHPARYVLEVTSERLDEFQVGDHVGFEEVILD